MHPEKFLRIGPAVTVMNIYSSLSGHHVKLKSGLYMHVLAANGNGNQNVVKNGD